MENNDRYWPSLFTADSEQVFAHKVELRGGSRTAATFKMEQFVIIVNRRRVLDPPLELQIAESINSNLMMICHL